MCVVQNIFGELDYSCFQRQLQLWPSVGLVSVVTVRERSKI